MPTWTAIATPGLEPIVSRELQGLGAQGTIGPGAYTFEASIDQGALLSARSRTPARLLLTLAEGPATTPRQLAALVRNVDWRPFFFRETEVALTISSRSSKLRFKDSLKRTVQRALQAACKELPAGPRALTSAQRLHVRVVDDQVRLALDAGGELLHRRGWRQDTGKAPLRENLAASLLVAAGWTGDEPLLDPFCGVGTIPIEAALLAANRPPAMGRRFAWQDWSALQSHPSPSLSAAVPPTPALSIIGADKEEIAIGRAQANATRARVNPQWLISDVATLEPPAETGLIVTNPPYGRRLGQHVGGVYRAFGTTLRDRFAGWRVLFLAPSAALAHAVDRDAERMTTFKNGGSRVGVWVIQP